MKIKLKNPDNIYVHILREVNKRRKKKFLSNPYFNNKIFVPATQLLVNDTISRDYYKGINGDTILGILEKFKGARKVRICIKTRRLFPISDEEKRGMMLMMRTGIPYSESFLYDLYYFNVSKLLERNIGIRK
jgi:hypothetical protein